MPGQPPLAARQWKRARLWLWLAGLALLLGALSYTVWLSYARQVVDVPVDSSVRPVGAVHFGGPREPPGLLRDLLLARVRAARPGSSIAMATYYFVDLDLARALIAASERGVEVTVVLDADPRHDGANAPVIALLKANGRRIRFALRTKPFGALHAKIYIFSDPRPVALVGSFNPSGGPTASAALLDDIGDQDRGHNLLVEMTSPGLVQVLGHYVERLAQDGSKSRFIPDQNWVYRDRDTQLYFFPRLLPNAIEAGLRRLGAGDRLWAAASHLDASFVGPLQAASRRGADVQLIVHDTERRVPQKSVLALQSAGVSVRRFVHSNGLPMHAKFLLMERGDQRISFFGSFNLNRSSRYFNDELLVRSTDPILFRTLRSRFRQMERELADEAKTAGR